MDADAVSRYLRDGFVVARAVFSDDEVEVLRDEIRRFAAGEYPVVNLPDSGSDGDPADILAVHFPHWVSAAVLEAVRQPRLVAAVGALAGAHLPEWDGAAKCMQSMLFAKPPGLPGQAWHQDERYIPTRDRSLLGAWIALDDATEENGCLHVIPGSHRSGYLWPTGPHGAPGEFDANDECHGFDDTAELAVPVQAGDVVLFSGHLLHRSFRNRSERPRRALVNHYCNAWSTLPWDVRGGVGPDDYRAVVPVNGDDPYAWKGYTDPPRAVWVRPHTG